MTIATTTIAPPTSVPVPGCSLSAIQTGAAPPDERDEEPVVPAPH